VALAFDLRNRAFAESWTEEFMATYARLGGTAAGMVPFDGSMETGYGDAVRELIALRPECAVFVANAVDSARLAQLFRRTDKKAPGRGGVGGH
jgi:branched-chain amino acid transport system substrate-binding protein